MIKSFVDSDTECIFRRKRSLKLPSEIQKTAYRKLIQLHASADIRDLRVPPGNHLEKLSDKRLPQWSIRITDRWRLVFDFEDGDAYRVQIVDYH